MVLYISRKPLQLNKEIISMDTRLSKVKDYKINMQKSTVFFSYIATTGISERELGEKSLLQLHK